jgi:hypothetical protein
MKDLTKMAQDFVRIADVLNTTFQEPMADLINRSNPVLSALSKKAVASQAIFLKGVVDSDHEAGPILDGADVSFGNVGTDYINPTLQWTTYAAKFSVPKRAMAQAANNPGALGSLLKSEVEQACKDLSTRIAADIFGGVTPNGLVGLQAVVDNANTYAGINRANFENFRSVVIDHANEELSTGVLYQLDELFFNANGYGWNESPGLFTGVTSSAILTKYKALMENIDLASLSTAHFVNQANTAGKLGIGATGFMGVPFLRDRNVSATGDTASTSRLYFLDMSKIHLCVLNSGPDAAIHQAQGFMSAPSVDGIKAEIEILGNKGESVQGYVKTYIQLATDNPKAAGAVIKNITSV